MSLPNLWSVPSKYSPKIFLSNKVHLSKLYSKCLLFSWFFLMEIQSAGWSIFKKQKQYSAVCYILNIILKTPYNVLQHPFGLLRWSLCIYIYPPALKVMLLYTTVESSLVLSNHSVFLQKILLTRSKVDVRGSQKIKLLLMCYTATNTSQKEKGLHYSHWVNPQCTYPFESNPDFTTCDLFDPLTPCTLLNL